MNLSNVPLFTDSLSGWWWWVGAGALLVVELLSGTFYLLMIALGFVAGGMARLAGVPWSGQIAVAALLAMGAILGVRVWRRRQRIGGDGVEDAGDGVKAVAGRYVGARRRRGGGGRGDPAMHLDVGASVYVMRWEDGRGRARYRGADWDVALAPGEPESVGWYRIRRIDGICLILEI